MEDVKLSVIILSYNTKDITEKCLRYIEEAARAAERKTKLQVETIVVENGSDGTSSLIKDKFKWVKLIEPKENTGFAKGNNIALKITKGDFLLLLNSDAYVEKETFVKAVKYFKNNPECDVLGCKLVFEDGKFQPSGGFLPTPFNTIAWMFWIDKLPLIKNFIKPVHPKDKDFFAEDRKLEWVMGAFLMMKREVYEKTKGFDENFFMYMEEVEWLKRIKEAGFNVYYTPNFSVTHLDKASSNFEIRKPLIREIQGLLYFHKKYYPKTFPIIKIAIYKGCLLRMLGYYIKGNKYLGDTYKEILKTI